MELQKFVMNEGVFDVPMELKDQTLNILSMPNGKGFSISVSRDEMPWGMTFEEFALAEYQKLSDAFNDFEELERFIIEIEKQRSPVFHFHWNSPQGKLAQILIMIECSKNVLIITASAKDSISKNQKEQIKQIFGSFTREKSENME